MLITRSKRYDHYRATGDPGVALDCHGIQVIELLDIELTRRDSRDIAQPGGLFASDTFSAPIRADHLLRSAIKLHQPLTNLAILHAVPDAVGRKTTVTLVNESALITLLLLSLPKTL